MQEYDFRIVYRKGALNTNADALSRLPVSHCAITQARPLYTSEALRTAQLEDSTVSKVLKARQQSTRPPDSREWLRQPLQRYRQFWSQLTIIKGVVCREYTPNPMSDAVIVPILPASLHKEALQRSHDAPAAGHQGSQRTLARLREEAYWVSMAKDVDKYCRECKRCQQSKLSMPQRAPLINMPIGRPWQMVAVDILEVPLSSNNNRYLLVLQDYFTKWADAIPLPDQTAARITGELIKVFSRHGPPKILHSDQGRNFESSILTQTLEAFGIHKSRTTAYHPQGDGMVERFNRSLLQLLRTYVDKQEDWERHLPLVLYAYRTSIHSSTGASPFLLTYGRNPSLAPFSKSTAFDSSSYSAHLRAKLAELQDFVEANLAASASNQKHSYDNRASTPPSFQVGNPVWLSVPTAGKLDPKWEGEWTVKSVKSPVSIEISNDSKNSTRVVHANRLRHRNVPSLVNSQPVEVSQRQWQPPTVDHLYLPPPPPPPAPITPPRYPTRNRRPPDFYGY